MAVKWFVDNGGRSLKHRKQNMFVFFVLLLINLLNLVEYSSQQGSQCKEKFVEEPNGKYKFVVDCSNLGLETFPNGLSDLTTSLYLNGNRLKSVDKSILAKLALLQDLDFSGNDLTSLPEGIFDHSTKLRTLDLRRNRLHCDWRVWWLVNFTKTLEQFNGYCFSPSSLRGRDVRKLTEKDVIVDCESKKRLHQNSKDGHYKFNMAGSSGNSIELLIYCHNMQSNTPKEYLSLPSAGRGNYVSGKNAHTTQCAGRNVTSSDVAQFAVEFDKVRIHLRSLSIVTDDLTFSSSAKNTKYGTGRICGIINNDTACIGADGGIDLRGTPFKIKNTVKWYTAENSELVNVLKKSGGTVVQIKCSGKCGGCSLSGAGALPLELMNAELSPYEACTRPLGLQDGSIQSRNITASSYLDRNFLPSYARLHGNGHGGWCAAKQDKNQFIQVDLTAMHTISGISTQGYKTYSDWVTSYNLQYKSDDDETWRLYSLFNNVKVFKGNSDSNSVVTHWFQPRLRANAIRIHPISWYDGDFLDHRICLRFELYGCQSDVSSYVIKLGSTKPCLRPVKSGRNITDGTALTYDSKCSGTDFMFQLKDNVILMHTLSGYCLDVSSNFTATLSSTCQRSRFTYQRINRGASQNSNFIIKDKLTNRCIRLRRSKNKRDVDVIFKKCSDISQILLILSKTGVVPLVPFFKEPVETRKVAMWSSQVFTCEFSSDPPSLLVWSKNFPMKSGGAKLEGDNFKVLSNGSLHVENVTWADRGDYFCNALNSQGSQMKLLRLDVHAVQNFIKRPQSRVIIVGQSVKFDCKVEGIPTPRILWKFMQQNSRDYMRIDRLDQRRFKLSPDGSLTIRNVHINDRGVYACIAKSPGKKKNATANLVVYVPPRIILSAKKKNLFVGQSARVNCLATGEPYPKVAWYSLLDLNSTNPAQRGLRDGNISLERVTKKDQGIYVCEATSVIGKATASFELVVTATCRLSYVRYADVSPRKSFHVEKQQVRFSCQKGFRLIGASVLECTQFGNWSEPLPRCVAKVTTKAETTPIRTSTSVKPATLPTLDIVVKNYTDGLVDELGLLQQLLQHSLAIQKQSSLDEKVESLNASLSALESLLTINSKDAGQDKSIKNFVMFSNVVSNLLDEDNSKIWKALQEKSPGTSKLLSVFDQYSRRQLGNLGSASNKNKNDAEIVTKNLVVKIHELVASSSQNAVEISIAANGKSKEKPRFTVPNEIINYGTKSTAVLVWFKTVSGLLSTTSTTSNQKINPLSNVVSLTISNVKDGTTLKKPIRIKYSAIKPLSKSAECVFWKFNSSDHGYWSNDGCKRFESKLKTTNNNDVICECNHLTNFAIIERTPLDGKRKPPKLFILSLSLSVIIGCGISILFAFCTCISHLCFSGHVRSDRRIIMINICACIMLGSSVFLGGALLSSFKLIKDDSTKYFCLVMSGSLQLFFVAFFSWMLAEAIQIFLSTKTVVDKSSGKLTMFYLLGWGKFSLVTIHSFTCKTPLFSYNLIDNIIPESVGV
eukprot:gene3344-3833_t